MRRRLSDRFYARHASKGGHAELFQLHREPAVVSRPSRRASTTAIGRDVVWMAMSGDLRSDAVLVLAVARRDQVALAELYQRHGGSLFCAALRVLSVRPLAEEVVQDVFNRLWQNHGPGRSVRGFLAVVLAGSVPSRAVDIVRSESARRRREDGEANALRPHHVLEDEVLDFVASQELREAVATLPEKEQQAISLAYFGGHSYVDVALLLGLPEGTVKSRIRSGLTRLRCAVMELGIDPRGANAVLCDL